MEMFQLQDTNDLTQEEIEELAESFKDYSDKKSEVSLTITNVTDDSLYNWIYAHTDWTIEEFAGQTLVGSNNLDFLDVEDEAHIRSLVDRLKFNQKEQGMDDVNFEDFEGSEYNFVTGILPFELGGRKFILEEISGGDELFVSIIEPEVRANVPLDSDDKNYSEVKQYIILD